MKGKFTLKKLVLTGAMILFIISLITSSVVYNNSKVQTTQDNAATVKTIQISLKNTDGVYVNKDVNITEPIINSTDGSFSLSGIDIVKGASNYLGRGYDDAQYTIQPNGGKLDCSGLVRVTLKDLKVTVDGVKQRNGTGDGYIGLPRSVMEWLQYNSDGYYFHEVGTYAIVSGSNDIYWTADRYNGPWSSVYSLKNTLKVKYNNQTNGMNVLKVNNPINSDLRWYNYYDASGKLVDLPIGTIVCAYGGSPYRPETGTDPRYIGPDHMWICIGNLGTDKESDAATKLVQMGIITESQKGYVKRVSSSNYWLIESAGGVGVRISNYDPNLNSTSNNKGVGTVWAYQIANGGQSGSFTMEVSKVDRSNPDKKLAGAKYNFQDRTTSPKSVYTDGYIPDGFEKKGGAITTTAPNGNAQLPIGGSSTSYTKTIDRTGDYIYNYSIQETAAPTGYQIAEKNQHFGFKVSTRLVGNTYQVASVDVYHGLWDSRKEGETWLWVTPGNSIWYTTDGKYVRTDPGASNTIAKFTLSGSGSNIKLSTTYYNKPIEGDYHVNIVKKPDGDTYDTSSDQNTKYKTAMEGAEFEVKQYLNYGLPVDDAHLSSVGRSGDNTDKVVTKFTVNGNNTDKLTRIKFAQRDKNGDIIQENNQDKYATDVNIFDDKATDVYTINETKAPDGTYKNWSRGAVSLVVYKKVNSNNSAYIIDKIKLVTGDKSYEAAIPTTGSAWIRVDKNGNKTDDTNNYAIAFEASTKAITVTWRNPTEVTDEYNIKVKKTDAKTGKAMKGVTFGIASLNPAGNLDGVYSESETTDDDGLASFEPIAMDRESASKIDKYRITETDLGTEYKNKYYLLNESIDFDVKKEYNETTKTYSIVGVRFSGETDFKKKINKKIKDKSNKEVPCTISVDDSTNTINITAENNGTTDVKFYLTKTDENKSTNLNDTELKVDKYVVDYRNMSLTNPETKLNGKLSTIADGKIDDINPMQISPTAYVYDIHEITAQPGYLNVFRKTVNGRSVELAYVRLIIRNDENDKLVVTQSIERTSNCTDDDYYKIEAVVDKPIVDQTNRTVKLNIKNPGTIVKLNLSKYKYNNATRATGGTFRVWLDTDELIGAEGNLGQGSALVKLPNITVGKHSLRVYETKAPDGLDNVFDQFEGVNGIRVDFTVKEDGSVEINGYTKNAETYNFVPESINKVAKDDEIADIANYVVVYYMDSTNTIYTAIKDPTHFDFELYKKLYTGKSDIAQEEKFNGTAKFTINEVKPKEAPKFNNTLPTDTQSKFFTEENVKVNSTYVYDIVETEVSDGFYKNLINKKIRVTVQVDANGNVYDESTGLTKYQIFDENDKEITDEDDKKELDAFIKLDVENNKVNLYIANMKTDYYKVRLCKVDKDGNPYKRKAVFSSVMTTSTSVESKKREGIETDPNTAIAFITEGDTEIEKGATHTYSITETSAPAGCIPIDGTVKLNVKFTNKASNNTIESATVEYYDASGKKSILDGLRINKTNTSTPMVTVYIPNEGTDFEVELLKVDSLGNLIKASEDSDGNYDGVVFSVRRGQVTQNPDAVISKEESEEFGKMLYQISADVSNRDVYNGVLVDGTIKDKIPLGENLRYIYHIQEKSTKTGYSNELENKEVIVYIDTKKNDEGKAYVDKVSYQILDLNDRARNVTSSYGKYVNYSLKNNNTKIELKLTNPNGYKVRLNKTDLAGNPIDSAVIEAYRDDTRVFALNEYYNPGTSKYEFSSGQSTITSKCIGIEKNEEQVWKIREVAVEYPYYNIFGTDKYVEVKVKMENSGDIKVTGYTVKGDDGKEYSNLKKYIDEVKIIEENGEKIVNVTFKNPSGYQLRLTKYEGDGTTPLSGAVVILDGTEVISGGSYHYENGYVAEVSTKKTFTITEKSTVANHINVLNGKELKLTVNTDAKGNITTSYKIMSGSSEVVPSDSVYDYVKVGRVEIIEGIPTIDVKILNPLSGKYNVNLYKVDENGKLIEKYDATFSGIRSNGKMNVIQINAKTSKGIAKIDEGVEVTDVNDIYTYQLNETQAPTGYDKFLQTIVLTTHFKDAQSKISIDETKSKLQVGSVTVPMSSKAGEFVGDNSAAWYLDTSTDTATINIYVKNKKKEFDLALRKYIYKVENENKSETPDPFRGPELDVFSLTIWKRYKTAAYYHTKKALKVDYGDTITYRIYVYNEANVKGYATEITDYLESGLEFVDNDFNKERGWVATKNSDGTTTVKTNYLQNTLLNECELQKYVLGAKNTPQWYAYVEIQCKVTRTPTDEKSFITDRAEITADKAVEFDDNGNEIVLGTCINGVKKGEITDRDSTALNAKKYHEKEMLKYGDSGEENEELDGAGHYPYYEGYEDDDDKETVYIEKFDYEFVLSKTDGKEEIDGAKFIINEELDNGEDKTVFNNIINKNTTISEPKARGDKTVELHKTYTYKITEESSKKNYENLLAGKYIKVKVYMDENKQMHSGEYQKADGLGYYSRYGFEIYNSTNNKIISEYDNNYGHLYNDIKISFKNNVYPPKVIVSIPNERIYYGSYNINLKKVDTANNKIVGIPFHINENYVETDNNGMINVSKYNSTATEEGTITIDKNNVGTKDYYTIEERIDYDDEGNIQSEYILIANEIELEISKSLDSVSEKYYVSNVKVNYNENESIDIPLASATSSATRIIDLKTIVGDTVPAAISITPNGTIAITAKNNTITGDYKLRLYKVDEKNNPISGIKFKVTGQSADMVTGSDGYTRTISKSITADNCNVVDEYTITEYKDEQGRVVGIKNPIKLSVAKENRATKYVAKSVKLTETVTGVETNESFQAVLSNVDIDDDSGRKVKVVANIDSQTNTITVNFENPPTENELNVKIKKINATTGKAVNGVTFSKKVNEEAATTATTADVNGESGIAYIDQNRKVSSVEKFSYIIRETGIPASESKMIKLTDYGWILSYSTKYDEKSKKYIIDESTIRISVQQFGYDSGSYEASQKQKAIAEKMIEKENGKYKYVSVSSDGLSLEFSVENENTTDFGLVIRKADMDTNEELADAKFTIKENGVEIAKDKTIAEFASRLASKTGIYTNTTHTYEIYETSPAKDYENILEKTYIELVIKIDETGKASATYTIKPQSSGSSTDVAEVKAKIQEYIDKNDDVSKFLEQDGNKFTLNIPNPKNTIPVDITLQKYELGDLTKGVNGAKFNIRRADIEISDDKTEISDVLSAFSSGEGVTSLPQITTLKSKRTIPIDHVDELVVGKSLYYEITESDVPDNYKSRFYQAIIKVTAVDKNTVSAYIITAKSSKTSGWDYGARDDESDHISVDTNGTTANVKWANELSYTFRLWKKSYVSDMPEGGPSAIEKGIGGANFEIVSSNGNITLVDGLIHETEAYEENNIHSSTTYTYTIREKESPTNPRHYNVFKDMDIIVKVRVGTDGMLSINNSTIEIKASEGKTVSEEELNFARKHSKLVIDPETSYVDVYLANPEVNNTYDLKIMKVSDKKEKDPVTGEEHYKGVPGIKFSLMGNQKNVLGSGKTGSDGTVTIKGLTPNDFTNNYAIAEDIPSAQEAGVTPLNGWIYLKADMTGITSDMDEDVIEAYLNEKNEDGTSKRFSLEFLDRRDANNGATVTIEGRTIIVKIVNRTTDIVFTTLKTDINNNPIVGQTVDGVYYSAPKFKIVNSKANPGQELWNGELLLGQYKQYRHAEKNAWYEYTVREESTANGFVNVTQGYDIRVHLETNSDGAVCDPKDEVARTTLALYPNGIDEPIYSIDEILKNGWVKLTVTYDKEKDEDTEKEVIVSSNVLLHVINPYEYKVQLNKKDKNGSAPVSAANIVAEKIVGADVKSLYDGNLEDRAMALNQVAKATTNTTNVYVDGDPVELDREPTTISEGNLIDWQNRFAIYDKKQTWRITETDVDAPYKNILKDKYIIVNTYFNGELRLAKHMEATDYSDSSTYQQCDFYVVDKDGNDVTLDYLDYVEVSTAKIDNEWTVVVTIKDPMIVRMGLYKKVDSSVDEPLHGANLTLTLGNQTAEIKNGSYQTEMLEAELSINSTITASVKELSTVKGYTNILGDKVLYYVFRNNNGNISVVSRFIIDHGNIVTSGDEYNYIMSHIDLRRTTDEDGYTAYKLYIENPTSFEFDLTKLDIDKNNLDGTEIRVNSSHSGMHILDGTAEGDIDAKSHLSFVEEDVQEHEVITYTITETHTKDGAYVNKFADPIRITAIVQGGQVSIVKKEHLTRRGGEFDKLEYFDCYVDPADKNKLSDGEMQTLVIKMENPPQIEVELTKSTAGSHQQRLPNTKFTIVSNDSHTGYTNHEGKINYIEEIHEPGNYTIRVYEDSVPTKKFVNILENKYMQFDIDVAADGTITYDSSSMKFFNKDNDSYYDNDVEITGDEATKLKEFCSVNVDNSTEISKVNIYVRDPVKFDMNLIKEATDGETLEGAEFDIVSVEGLFDTIHTTTDLYGEIAKSIEMARPGVYEFHITEIKPAGNQYDNVLGDNMIVIFVWLKDNGEIELIANKYGSQFGSDVSDGQKYLVKQQNGGPVSEDDEASVREFVTVETHNNNDSQPDGVTIRIENPVQTKVDIIKRQYTSDGESEEPLADTRFTVIKNGNEMLLNNQVVNEEVEIEEHYLSDDVNYYDIYENGTNTNGAYVNILANRFIRVYTETYSDGILSVNDSEGEGNDHYFEIYEGQHYGPAKKLDRDQYSELYSYIDVWAEPNSDGIYVLNVKVLNPITIRVGVLKKQYGEHGQPIPGVSVTVISENTGDHNITTKAYEDVFSEGNIKPGTYDFIIKENENPNPRYINVLKDRYAKANVTISKTGAITCNNIKFYTDNKDNNYTNDPEVSAEVKAVLQDKVYAVIDDSQRVQKITFVIQNPVTMKFIVNKLDLAEGGLEGATFDVIKYVGDSDEVEKGMTSKDTDKDGQIVFEDGDYMKAGIYRYEVTELKPAAEKYVNILDCYEDGSKYKVVIYIKLGLDGKTEIVKDAAGTPYTNGERFKYTIVNRENKEAEIPAEVTEIVHKYLFVSRTASTATESDKIEVDVYNTPQIDIDVIKVTKDSDKNEEKPLAGTKFSAEADDGRGLFEDIPATQDKEYTFKNVNPGVHEFYITESEGVVNGGYINVLEDRYVKVYTTVAADGVMKITDSTGKEDPDYFEIYDGQYNDRSGSRMLNRTEYAKIYECVSVESVKQANGVYKLNLKVNNPERNYKIVLNKKVFGEEDINMEGIEFFIRGTFDNQGHQLKTDKDGNLSFEEKRVPVGTYTYYVTETNTSGPEFVNVLDNNYIAVILKVNQDGSIEIVDSEGVADGNENRYYILDSKCTQIINEDETIVDDFVRVAANNEVDTPELDFFIKDPERINLKLVKRDDLTNENLNNVTFTTNVFYQSADATADPTDADKAELVNAETFEKIDISTIKTDTVDGVDGVILVPDILIDKTGTYTFVFHEESTDGLFKYLYKSHAEDITLKIDITVETNSEGRPIGYKVGQPRIVTGAKYVDDESTLTTPSKIQLVRAEVLNTPIRGHYDLILNKLDKYTSAKLDGAEFDIRAEKDGVAYELYEDVDDLRIENAIIPDHFTVQNGELRIENIRITPPPYQAPAEDGTLETFNIILTETKAPKGYMLLDDPIVLEVTTAIEGKYDDAEYVVKSVNLISGENHELVTQTFGKNEINVVAKDEYFDLALRKSIVSVAYSDSDDAKITEDETENRVPEIYEDDELFDLNPDVTTANYRHVKNHVRVYGGQEVIYKLRVYNEGEIDGYAEEITDHLPEGLIFLPDDKFNTDRGWTYDLNDQTLRTVKTTFLSKENNPNNDRFNAENNLIKALDADTGVIDCKEIEIKCKVSDNLRPGVILTNIAEITESKAEGRTQETVDRDSVTDNADVPDGKKLQEYKEDELTDNREDYVPGQEDDDDFEKLIVVEFDLALRKYITAINEEEVLAEETEEKFTDKVVENTEDILGEGTASDDTEGTNEGANTNIVDESESENENTEEETTQETDENKGTDEESEEEIDSDNMIKYDREPRVNVSTLKSGDQESIYKDPEEPTTAIYEHTKAPVEVSVDDIVTYTLEIFNEGTVDGYASLIKDDIPEGVEFVPYTEGDGSVNDKYRWKMVNENDEEVTDPKEAKYIVSDYLSKDNEEEEFSNLIRAFDPVTGTRLDSKYVQVQFRVICKQDYPKIITNYAQISEDSDESGKGVKDRDSTTNEWIDGEDDQDVEHIWVTYMDLALRKFITGVTDYKTGKTEEITYRIPQVDPTALINETGTTAKYEHTKEPVLVHTNDVVIYTLRIYNEGSKDGYATQIKDDLPEGLEFLPDHEVNKYYEWSLVDKNDKPVTRLEDAEYAVTNYLSKDNETEERQNLLKSFDYYDYENDKPAKRETPEYKDIKIAFKVTEPQTSDRILINEAQISEQTDGKGVHREDRDSTPNEWLGEDDEDIEKVRVLYFDLALRKWVTKAIVTQDGKETVFETGHHAEDDPESVVKVDLKKSKINKVVVKFEYQIRITNEGEIDGYAKEIKDHIPEGLRFDPADNPTWTQLEENVIVTDQLKDTLLKPGESAEVTVVLTWINSGDNLGLKVNVAEISKDYNDYGTHDIDSTPDNYVWGEDDIDDAPVMLAVKTGNAVFGYIAIAVFVGAVIVIGVRRIKKINEG